MHEPEAPPIAWGQLALGDDGIWLKEIVWKEAVAGFTHVVPAMLVDRIYEFALSCAPLDPRLGRLWPERPTLPKGESITYPGKSTLDRLVEAALSPSQQPAHTHAESIMAYGVDRPHVVLPELKPSMRVRCLDPRSSRFRSEGVVINCVAGAGFSVDYSCGTDAWCPAYPADDWLTRIFPTDASVLPPRVGMRCTGIMCESDLREGALREGVIETVTEILTVKPDTGNSTRWHWPAAEWLRAIWPVALTEKVR